MSKISIIIPIYNAERYVLDCLKSIENQTFKDFEVILVDDGSEDNTVRVCNEYIKKSEMNIKLYKKKNGGPSSARNYGLTKACAKYICFIDSDDLIKEDHLDVLYNNKSDFVVEGYIERLSTNDKIIVPRETGIISSKEDLAINLLNNVNSQIYNPPFNKLYKLMYILTNTKVNKERN